jgi:dihydroorotase
VSHCSVEDLAAQSYDLVIKGGHVIDPANDIDRVMDVAVSGGKIARVAAQISATNARKTASATGLFVTPGLIDIHTHVYVGGRPAAVFPDDTVLPAGTTTVVDAGVSGWRTFDDFKNPAPTAAKVKQHREFIVGIKTAHFGLPGWEALKRAVESGRLSDTPVLVDNHVLTGSGRGTQEKGLDILRPGDIHTHFYNDRRLELLDRFNGKVQDYMLEARRRGVLFDLGHGGGTFLWPVAARAMRRGFVPDTISTDLHPESVLLPAVDMPNCISKLMALGMSLQDAILRSTVNPARAIHRFQELGTLAEGSVADLAIFELQQGIFAFVDSWDKKLLGTRKLKCVLTVRAGEILFDENGFSAPLWTNAGDYGVIP